MIAVARPDESQVNVTCRPNDIARLVSDFRDKLLFGNLVVLSSAVLHFARDDEDKRYVVDQEMLGTPPRAYCAFTAAFAASRRAFSSTTSRYAT